MSINLKSNFAYSMMVVSASINVTNLKSSRQNTIWFEYLIVISSKFTFGVWLLCSWPVHRKLLSPANSPENVQTSTCQLKKYKPRDSIGISCQSPDRLKKISVFLRNIPNRQIVSQVHSNIYISLSPIYCIVQNEYWTCSGRSPWVQSLWVCSGRSL